MLYLNGAVFTYAEKSWLEKKNFWNLKKSQTFQVFVQQ